MKAVCSCARDINAKPAKSANLIIILTCQIPEPSYTYIINLIYPPPPVRITIVIY